MWWSSHKKYYFLEINHNNYHHRTQQNKDKIVWKKQNWTWKTCTQQINMIMHGNHIRFLFIWSILESNQLFESGECTLPTKMFNNTNKIQISFMIKKEDKFYSIVDQKKTFFDRIIININIDIDRQESWHNFQIYYYITIHWRCVHHNVISISIDWWR